jgi:tripartite ATP-independent transporter DctP family solute receptor
MKVLMIVLMFAFAATITGIGTRDAGAAVTIRIGATPSPTHSYSVVAKTFKQEVESKTNGAVKVTYHGGGVMGGERQMVEAVVRGDLDMAWTSDIGVAAVFPELGFVNLPYLFKNYAEVDAKYRNGWIGQYVIKHLDGKGIKVLANGENDYRGLTNSKRPITKGEDLKGLKLRVPEVPMYIDFYKALGVLPTPMAVTELTTALQQGTVDGQDNGAIITYDFGMHTFQKYATKANQIYSGMQMCLSKKTWDKLTPEQQKIVMDAAGKASDEQVRLNRENVAKSYAAMAKAGVQVIEATPQLVSDLKAASVKVWNDPKWEKAYTKEVMDRIKKEAGK